MKEKTTKNIHRIYKRTRNSNSERCEEIGKYTKPKMDSICGTDYEKQSSKITKGIDILIGTPEELRYYKIKFLV